MKRFSRGLLAVTVLIAALAPAHADDVFISGLRPYERPEGVPRLVEEPHPRAWYVAALTGVSPPYPHSLYFLDVQGGWYTPFTVPGMPGPYDIRGWHQSK